jgi:ATP-binding cassette, subfamily B, bacterial
MARAVLRIWRPFRGAAVLMAARWNIAVLTPRGGAVLAAAIAAINIVLGALPVAFVVAASVVVGRVPAAVRDGIGSAQWRSLVAAFVLAAIAFVAQQVLAPLEVALGELLSRRVDGQVLDDLMSASLASRTVAPLEDPATLDDLRTAVRELEANLQSPGRACAGQLSLIARYTQLAGYAVIVAVAFSWLAGAALVASVMLFRYGQRGGLRKYAQVKADLASAERKADYLRELAIEPPAGKELRIFGLTDWLSGRFRGAFLRTLEPVWVARRRILLWPFIFFASWGVLVAATTFGVIGAAGAGRLSLTSFALVVQAFLGALRLASHYPEADTQTAFGMIAHDAVRRFQHRTSSQDSGGKQAGTWSAQADAGPDPKREIRFSRIAFRYPGQDRPVLDDLNLTLPIGKCTAIVGLNGAGKTTLVKLLARLHEPTAGAITADGTDISSYRADQWRAKIAVIFQDFVRYEIPAADNIAFGAVAASADQAGIEAAARAAGIDKVLGQLPRGLDTPLAGHLTGGTDLSGGQWQRVALARALFGLRHGARLVVLDEPTASLDVRAEARFFDEFAALTQDTTTVLISHRFSTVRHADLIVVLDGGRVVEQGSHQELMAQRGLYAWLFELQADRFAGAAPGSACLPNDDADEGVLA